MPPRLPSAVTTIFSGTTVTRPAPATCWLIYAGFLTPPRWLLYKQGASQTFLATSKPGVKCFHAVSSPPTPYRLTRIGRRDVPPRRQRRLLFQLRPFHLGILVRRCRRRRPQCFRGGLYPRPRFLSQS